MSTPASKLASLPEKQNPEAKLRGSLLPDEDYLRALRATPVIPTAFALPEGPDSLRSPVFAFIRLDE